MKILIDGLSAREGGGVTYFRQIVPALVRANPHNEYSVLLSPQYQQGLISSLQSGVQVAQADLSAGDPLRRIWFQQIAMRKLIRRKGFDLLFSISETGTINPPCPHVVLARNLKIYASVSSFASVAQQLKLVAFRLTREPVAFLSCRGADRVVFVSHHFRDHVVRQLQLDPAKTRVVYHGVSPEFGIRAGQSGNGNRSKLPWQGPYLLSVSSITAHKNVENLIRAFAILRKRNSDTMKLLLAGTTDETTHHNSLLSLARSLGVAEHVHFLGRVDHASLPDFYVGASGFVFPSRLESFGQPLVEAMASGVPVASSSLPVCREICGDAALYFDPTDTADMAAQLSTLLENEAVRETLISRGLERASTFSWHRCATEMTDIFDEVHCEAAFG